MELLSDSNIWYLISFILFAAAAWRFGKDKFLQLIDNRIAAIRREIDTAESLRVEAQELLAQYQRKQRDAAKEAETIVKTAEEHAKAIREDAEKELDVIMKRREQQLQDRLARMEAIALQNIQAHAAELAIQATQEIISEKLDKKTNDNLVQQSIKTIASS